MNRGEEPVVGEPDDDDAGESFWQWVALVVLLACWLAEMSLSG
jgi:hypothetical protein